MTFSRNAQVQWYYNINGGRWRRHPTTYRLRLWSANLNRLTVPRRRLSTYGCQAFYHAGPTVWNSLPNELRNSNSFDGFKRFLETNSAVTSVTSALEVFQRQYDMRYINLRLTYLLSVTESSQRQTDKRNCCWWRFSSSFSWSFFLNTSSLDLIASSSSESRCWTTHVAWSSWQRSWWTSVWLEHCCQ